jgi:glyoxylase-like metal-dependent hydrolase (beta-lactamase superfamily II)
MNVLALDLDVIVFVSAFWQTTCTAIRSGDEGFVIDSPVLPGELEALPQVLERSGFPVSGLLVTHGDWDHLLGRHAFPEASLGCGESTVARLGAEPEAAQRELKEFDEDHYVAGRPPLALDEVQSLPVPGRLGLGDRDRELELHPTPGHTSDGTTFLAPWLGVLVCGDYISPVEIPWISPGGSIETYLRTLKLLRTLVDRASTVVPGHGAPMEAERARELLDEDERYLTALGQWGAQAPLPPARQTRAQQRIHAQNAQQLS